MGLGDFFGKVAGDAVKKVQEQNELYQKYMVEYDLFDDERLKKRYIEESNFTKKQAMRTLLIQRGLIKNE